MGILIDTSILINLERRDLHLAERVRGREDQEAFLSVISASELLYGVHRAPTAAIRNRRQAFVEGVLAILPVLPVDLVTARLHARLTSELSTRGIMIGTHDAWLAASCLAHDLSLATLNLREFQRVPGLVIEDWGGGG